MSGVKDMTGLVFGRLAVVSRCELPRPRKQAHWVCRCDCGKKTTVSGNQLRSGKTKSCGCLNLDVNRARMTRHGLSKTAEHKAWRKMLSRCDDKADISWPRYGGRGVRVCDSWRVFENFYADMGPKPSPLHSIDRINVDGNYEPSNCRWATSLEQNNNRRSNRVIEHAGKRLTLAGWSRETGVQAGTIAFRIKKGWPLEKALTPIR